VVVAAALVPNEGARELAEILGLTCNKDDFFVEEDYKLSPIDTGQRGIYLAGCCQGIKDIADTSAQGSAAASKVQVFLSSIRRQKQSVV
ncbi:MAG: disulfide reductase, partial [Deltaproteobacteria bacterium]|nr:disulfide reductase [Deltaproteobacteria bacterium]